MWEIIRDFWVPRLLFLATLGMAVALAGTVLLAPWLVEENQPGVFPLFAGDAIVRRTTFASALGLAVTAFVFFRPGGMVFFRKRDKDPVPPPMAGA